MAGRCEGDCAAGLLRCDSRCVDPRNNPEHCGGCGQACGAGEACVEGDEGTSSCQCAPSVSWPCLETATAAAGVGARLDVADVVTLTTGDGDELVVVAGIFGRAPVDFGGQVRTPVGDDDIFIAAYDPGLGLAWLYTIGASGRSQQVHDLEVAPDGTVYCAAAIRADGSQSISPGDLPVSGLRGAFQGALIQIDPRLGASMRVPRVALVQGTSGNQYLDAVVVSGGEVLVAGHQNGDTSFLDGCITSVGRNAFVATLDPQTEALSCHGLVSAGNPNNQSLADPGDLDLEVDATGALHLIGSATEGEIRPVDGGPPISLQLDATSTTTTGFDVVYRPMGNGYVLDHALILGDAPGNRAARWLRGARADDGTLGLAGWFAGSARLVVRRDGPPDVVCAANLITGTSRQAVVVGLAAGSDCPTWAWSSGGTGNDSAHVIDPIPGGFLILGEYNLRISAGSFEAERPDEGQGYFLLSLASSGTARWLLGDLEGGGVPSISRRGGVAALVGSDDVELFWAGRQSSPGPGLPAWTEGTGQSLLGRLRLGL